MVNKQAGAVLDRIDDPGGFFGGYGRAAIAAAHKRAVPEPALIDIVRAVYHHAAFQGLGVVTRFHPHDLQGKAVLAVIGVLGHVKPEAALQRFGLVGKLRSELSAGIAAMRHIGIQYQGIVFHVHDIHSLVVGRLAEIADGQVGFPHLLALLQVPKAFVGTDKSLFRQPFFFQSHALVQRSGFGFCCCRYRDGCYRLRLYFG